MDLIFFITGLTILLFGGDLLLKAAVAIAVRFNISKVVVGMTIVSFATSLPELMTSIRAALDGFPDLSLGNVVGSNIANLGFVLGTVLLFGKIEIKKTFHKYDWPVVLGVSGLLIFFIYDGLISRFEGVFLLFTLLLVLISLFKFQPPLISDQIDEIKSNKSWLWISAYTLLGSFGLGLGSHWLVEGAVGLARAFDISERIIAITLISIGTSLPELVASGMAILRKESGISIGNLIGSNLFNILTVLGITSIIHPLYVVDQRLLEFDIWVMLAFTVLILPLVLIPKIFQLSWKTGIVLLLTYIAYIITTLS
jgi:cation:H+ antiporter